jgi:hypothetical protein
MMRTHVWLLVWFAATAAVACSESDAGDRPLVSTPVDAGSSDAMADGDDADRLPDAASDGRTDAPDASPDGSALCNDLVNSAPVVNEVSVPGSPPAPLGGTIADGTYFRAKYEVYSGSDGGSGSTGQTRQDEILIVHDSPTHLTIQQVIRANGGAEARGTVAADVIGSTLSMSETCPHVTSVVTKQYTATPAEIVVIDGASVSTYERH